MDIGRYSGLLYHDWVKDQALTLGVGYEVLHAEGISISQFHRPRL